MKQNNLEKLNWASAIVDIVIIVLAVYSSNYYLLWLLVLTGGYKLNIKEK